MAKIHHIAFFAENPAKMGEFYENVFGMKITGRSDDGDVWITDGYMDIALILARTEQMKKRRGINHWGFTLEPEEKAAVYRKLEKYGVKPFDPRVDRPEADRPYVEDAAKDPDGNRFDLTTAMRTLRTQKAIDERNSAAAGVSSARIKHLALFTENPKRLSDFYCDVFGMKLTGVTGRGAYWITDGYVDYALLWKRTEKMPQGINHFGFTLQTDHKPAVYAKLASLGVDIFQPGQDRPYVEDAAKDVEGNRFDMSSAMREIDQEMARPRTETELRRIEAETV
jgi:catechol 2,3-dioxygenase-like lactoylglutathione lyase family enzyme